MIVHRLFDSTPDLSRCAFLRDRSTNEARAGLLRACRQPFSRDRDVGLSVGSPSLVGTLVENSSDAVINGRPLKKRSPVLADGTDQRQDASLRWN